MQGFEDLPGDNSQADASENDEDERQQARALATTLRKWREAVGLTRLTLAQRVGIQESYLSRLERGFYHRPALGVLQKLAEALGQPVEELYQQAGITFRSPTPNKNSSDLPELSHYLSQVADLPYDDRAIIEKVLRGIFNQELKSPH